MAADSLVVFGWRAEEDPDAGIGSSVVAVKLPTMVILVLVITMAKANRQSEVNLRCIFAAKSSDGIRERGKTAKQMCCEHRLHRSRRRRSCYTCQPVLILPLFLDVVYFRPRMQDTVPGRLTTGSML